MAEDQQKMRMQVRGMTCTGCERHVQNALLRAGALEAKADFQTGQVEFRIPVEVAQSILSREVERAGYQPGRLEEVFGVLTPSPTTKPDFDFVVIGSGSAAFAAAIEAKGVGARVAMVERGIVGGTCVNIGCVPSKALLRASEIQYLSAHHPFPGLHTSAGSVDMRSLVLQKDELVQSLRGKKYEDLVPEYGIELIRGEATFVDRETLQVGERHVTGGRYLIATGASPAIPSIPGLASTRYLTSTTALQLDHIPEHLVVIGAGYIALELGQMFRYLGARVTLMQRHPQILSTYEPEIAQIIRQMLERDGIDIVTGATYQRVEETEGEIRVYLQVNGEERIISGDALLVATGRVPNTATLDLERAGVTIGKREEVIVNENLRTTNPLVYAAGDVTMGPQFVYVAAYEGALAARNALHAEQRAKDLRAVPTITFTHPAVATVGLTERAAQAAGYQVKTSVLPLEAIARALVNRDTLGVLKLVADAKSGRLLGAHIAADQAGEVIYAATLAVRHGLTVEDLRETMAPYLTMAEGMRLAALTFDKDVSKLSCCAG